MRKSSFRRALDCCATSDMLLVLVRNRPGTMSYTIGQIYQVQTFRCWGIAEFLQPELCCPFGVPSNVENTYE